MSFRRFFQRLLPFLLAPVYFFLAWSWRIRETGPPEILRRYVQSDEREPCLFAHWHGDELALVGYYRYRRLAVLSSLSADGSLMAKTLELLGYQVFRGSSSKGGARGLIGLIRAVKEGSQAALAVDGPKGPIYEVKGGIIELAMRTGQPILPVRTSCANAWVFQKAWNKCYLPKPFAIVRVEYGETIHIAKRSGRDELGTHCAGVKKQLDGLLGGPEKEA